MLHTPVVLHVQSLLICAEFVDLYLAFLCVYKQSAATPPQLGRLMCTSPVTEDEQLSKAALFTRYVEALPRAASKARDMQQLVDLLGALLGEVRSVVGWDPGAHQELFRWVLVCLCHFDMCVYCVYIVIFVL